MSGVSITDAKLEVTTTEQQALKQLEEVIFDFMNGTKWTKDKFTMEERINCSVQLQITNIPTMGTFSGSIQVLIVGQLSILVIIHLFLIFWMKT